MKGEAHIKQILNKFIQIFSSIRLAIILLIVLVGIMVLGTIIPQHQSLGRYIGLYGGFIGRIISFLGLNDTFHSILFNILMVLFGLNLVVCSSTRIKFLQNILFEPRVKRNKQSFQSLEDSRIIKINDDSVKRLIDRTKSFLGEKNYSIFSKDESPKKYFLFQKGKWGRLGPEVVHLSIIIILIGGVIGGLLGFSTTLEVVEGEKKPIPRTDSYIKLNDFSINYYEDKYRIDLYRPADGTYKHDRQLTLTLGKVKRYGDLDLLLRKNENGNSDPQKLMLVARRNEKEQILELSGETQEVMLPGNTGAILRRFTQQYTSKVEVLSSQEEVIRESLVQVNSPITVNGIKLYQQSYQPGTLKMPEPQWVKLEVYRDTTGGSDIAWKGSVNLGEEIEISDNTTIMATKFYPNLSINETGTAVNLSETPNNPAVYLKIEKSNVGERGQTSQSSMDKDLSRWVFEKYGDIHRSMKVGDRVQSYRYKLIDYGPVVEAGDRSIFQVSNTPGINFVYTGFGLLMVGLALSFFVFHRQIWLLVDEGEREISIGGKCNKEIKSFSDDLEELYRLLEGRS